MIAVVIGAIPFVLVSGRAESESEREAPVDAFVGNNHRRMCAMLRNASRIEFRMADGFLPSVKAATPPTDSHAKRLRLDSPPWTSSRPTSAVDDDTTATRTP